MPTDRETDSRAFRAWFQAHYQQDDTFGRFVYVTQLAWDAALVWERERVRREEGDEHLIGGESETTNRKAQAAGAT